MLEFNIKSKKPPTKEFPEIKQQLWNDTIVTVCKKTNYMSQLTIEDVLRI